MTRVDGTARGAPPVFRPRTARSFDTRPMPLRCELQAHDGAGARSVAPLLAASAILAAVPAQARLIGTGLAAFYGSLTHIVLTPADLLVVVALALLAGQQGTRISRWSLLVFPVAWLASGSVAARFPSASAMPLLTAFAFACAGVLVAFDAKLRPAAVGTFVIAAGSLHGYVNGLTMAWGEVSALGVAGIATAIISLFAIFSAQVITLQTEWSRAAVRVTSGWIAACSVLILGWLGHSLA